MKVESEYEQMAELKELLASPNVIGRTFLEKLVLAIIDGHSPINEAEREKRLRAAMRALRGEYHKKGKGKDDRMALYWMATQYIGKHGVGSFFGMENQYIGLVTIRPMLHSEQDGYIDFEDETALARAAAKKFGLYSNMVEDSSVDKRLRDAFIERKEQLVLGIVNSENQVHYVEHQILSEIAEKFSLMNIPIKVPENPSAF